MTYWRLFYHLVWATHERVPLLGAAEEAIVRRSFELTYADLDLIPHAAGFMPDHLHLVVSIPPKVAVAEAVRRLKGGSSHAINDAWGRREATFNWQGEYSVLSFGDRALDSVVAYVSDQPARHAAKRIIPRLEWVDDPSRGSS